MTSSDISVPVWATPKGVLVAILGYCLVFVVINGVLASNINNDDLIESYFAQTLALNYGARNPPLFDWLLYGLQQIIGSGRFSLVILRYALLATSAWLIYLIARRTIRDPRLQALAVFALTLSWLIGYHGHRILTHSNVMIIGIAGTMLTLIDLRNRPAPWRYAALGAFIVIGTLGKFGFAAFAAVAFVAMLTIREYRVVALDRGILLTLVVAAVPIAAFFTAIYLQNFRVAGAIYAVLAPDGHSTITSNIFAWLAGIAGYLLPFLAVFAAAFGAKALHGSSQLHDAATVKLIGIIAIVGTLVALGAAIGGSPNSRDRYFHLWYFLLPVAVFAVLDRAKVDAYRIRLFNLATIAITAMVAAIFLAQRLVPSAELCNACTQSAPYPALGREIEARTGARPTVITANINEAGSVRASLSGVRTIAADDLIARGVPRPPGGCIMVWPADEGVPMPLVLRNIATQAGLDPSRAEIVTIEWWAPLLPGGRVSRWALLNLPATAATCQ